MFLNQLEIFGFKSFPSKLNLKFSEGITAIVGPNGCGKTNIVDAIRWVMGEQKTTLLRSEQMEDVIFNGTAQRKPLNLAEVSLTIDNTLGLLPNEYSEVMITRRLFRSGESEYLLNKTSCRRKDIVDLFLDTGMAPHAYSVIELPMVESILGGQADALRVLFEEASGIAKYKARRREALRKLARTQDNLLRLGDIVGEVEKNVRSLKRQAAAAQRHQRYEQDLRYHELVLASTRYHHLGEERKRLEERLNEVKARSGGTQEHLQIQEEREEQLREQLSGRETELASLRLRLSQQDEAIHRLNEQILVGEERREGLSSQRTRLQSEVKELEQRHLDLGREHKERATKKKQLLQHLTTAGKTLEERETHLSHLDGQLLQRQTARERLREQVARLSDRKNDLRQQLVSLGGSQKTSQQRAEDIAQELQRTDLQLKEAQSTADDLENRWRQEEQKAAELEQQLRQAHEERHTALAELEEITADIQQRRRQMEIHRSRSDVLRGIQESYEGYHVGVKAVLTELSHLKGVIGTVADILETEQQYIPAIEAVLGEAAQYIVVQQQSIALTAIEYLRTHRAGRATFLVLEEAKRLGDRPRSPKMLSKKGVVSWAPDVVGCIPQHRPVVEFLLGQVLIVERLEPHLLESIGDNDAEPHIVSLEGDVFHPPVFLQGGQILEGSELLDRRERQQEEESAAEELIRQIEQMERAASQAKTRVEQRTDDVTHLEKALQDHRAEMSPLERALQETRLQKKFLLQRQSELKAEQGELDRKSDAPQGPVEHLTEKLSDVDARLSDKEEQLHQLDEEVRSLEHTSREAMKAVSEARVELVSLEGRQAQIQSEEDRWHQIETELQSTMASRGQEIEQVDGKMRELDQQIEHHKEEIQVLQTQREELLSTQHTLQTESESLRGEFEALETDIKNDQRIRERAQEEIHQLELQLAELQMKQQSARERIESEYEVDLRTFTADQKDEESAMEPAEREKRIHFLRHRIQAMGPVNMAALEEYHTQKKRHDFLTTERDDLVKSEQNLNQVIADLNRRARSLFSETFRNVNDNFQEIFKQMFNGGEAHLMLNSKRDPLEADIQIFACPGGKKLRHIAQLSGGEKALTAISLLFALYQVKPSPFCVLDEVDAPLDDANIGRFVSMLKILSQKSQFIIITHNKNTMAAANVLYGVTMQQLGVSKVVSVNLTSRETNEPVMEKTTA
jgi:chromosome segregation protein